MVSISGHLCGVYILKQVLWSMPSDTFKSAGSKDGSRNSGK